MSSAALTTRIRDINAHLAALLPGAQSALAGDSIFTVDELRSLALPISEMAPILAAANLAPQDPQVTAQLQTYKAHLRNLQPTLERLRQMLLALRSQLASNQAHLKAASDWAAALSTTQHP
jgi:hypothetical protein